MGTAHQQAGGIATAERWPIEGRSPLISVIVPTYNRAHLIRAAIDSVLTQTYANWELIIVDDNSTDNTQEVVRPYVESDSRIRCVFNDSYPHCCAGARNRGIDEIRGEFVAFLDSDDSWEDFHLEELLGCLLENPDLDWVFGDIRRVSREGRVVVASKFHAEWEGYGHFRTETRGMVHIFSPDGLVENGLRYGIPASLQASLIRIRLFGQFRIREVFGVEDRLFSLEAAARGCRIGYVDRIHLNYLIHDQNVSGSNSNPDFDHRYKVNKAVEQYWSRYVPDVIPMTRSRQRIIRQHLADHLVWGLAYNVLRPAGRKAEAVRCILRAIAYRPWNLRYWKTLAGTLIKKPG